jgi:hypothetical protein
MPNPLGQPKLFSKPKSPIERDFAENFNLAQIPNFPRFLRVSEKSECGNQDNYFWGANGPNHEPPLIILHHINGPVKSLGHAP